MREGLRAEGEGAGRQAEEWLSLAAAGHKQEPSLMELITQDQMNQLIANGRKQAAVKGTEHECDFEPVVRLFTPDAGATWLLTEVEPDEHDVAWGLCDLGFGTPEFGTVSLSEIRALRGRFGLPVERDLHWKPNGPISAYVQASHKARRIVEPTRQTPTEEAAR
jgi:hypothetical protein